MEKSNKKSIAIYLSIMLIILTLSHSKVKKIESDSSCESEESYGLYNLSKIDNVHFCSSILEAEELCKTCDESDIIIVDQSDFNDPNIKIMSSYRVTDVQEMRKILEIIREYCNNKDSEWNRSIESMLNEWTIHNICSSLLIKRSSTDDVDLNNADEIVYKSKIITKILGN